MKKRKPSLSQTLTVSVILSVLVLFLESPFVRSFLESLAAECYYSYWLWLLLQFSKSGLERERPLAPSISCLPTYSTYIHPTKDKGEGRRRKEGHLGTVRLRQARRKQEREGQFTDITNTATVPLTLHHYHYQ